MLQMKATSRRASVFLSYIAAGVVFALGAYDCFAGDFIDPLIPAYPAGFDEPLHKISPDLIKTHQQFVSLLQQDHLSDFKSTSSVSFEAFNFGMDSEIRKNTRTSGTSYLGYFIGNNAQWQENHIGYTNIKMDLGEAIRVRTRLAASTYEASRQFFSSLGERKIPEEQRLSRFEHAGSSLGTAAHIRIEEDVLRFGNTKVTLFQEYARVDPFFEDIKFSDKAFKKQTKEDVFSRPDRETDTYGISLAQGFSGVMFSRSSISNIVESPIGFYRENRFDSKAWLGLRESTKDLWSTADPLWGNLMPTSVWVSYSEGAIRRNGPDLPTGPVTEQAAGASWQWGDTYAHLSVWRGLNSSPQQVSNLAAHWFGDGADFSVGLQNKLWKISSYLSLTRSNYEHGFNNTDNSSIYGGVNFSFMLENWPTVTLALDSGSYAAHTRSDSSDVGRTLKAGIMLDFSKYLVERSGHKLQFVYYAQNERFDSKWGAINSHKLTLDHVFGAVIQINVGSLNIWM